MFAPSSLPLRLLALARVDVGRLDLELARLALAFTSVLALVFTFLTLAGLTFAGFTFVPAGTSAAPPVGPGVAAGVQTAGLPAHRPPVRPIQSRTTCAARLGVWSA